MCNRDKYICVCVCLWVLSHFHSIYKNAYKTFQQRSFPIAQGVKNLPAMQKTREMWIWSLEGDDPMEEEMGTYSSILAWRIPWTEEMADYSPWCHKESDKTKWLNITTKRRYYLLRIFFKLFIFNWRMITLQYCIGICPTSTWISHHIHVCWDIFSWSPWFRSYSLIWKQSNMTH